LREEGDGKEKRKKRGVHAGFTSLRKSYYTSNPPDRVSAITSRKPTQAEKPPRQEEGEKKIRGNHKKKTKRGPKVTSYAGEPVKELEEGGEETELVKEVIGS